MNDFRKFATQHLGMNGMVIDDVISQSRNTSIRIFLKSES